MFKSVLLKLLYYLSLSGYNTFYKYMMVKENMDSYSLENGFMKMYKTSSNSVSYLNVFVLCFVCLFLIDFLKAVFVFYMSKKPFKEVFCNIHCHLKYIIFILISCGLLFLNSILSLIGLITGFLFYILDVKKCFSKGCFWIIFLLDLFSFVCLYFISI